MGELTRGDVVRLKSGGPDMTVTHVLPGGMIGCQWFEKGELKQGTFLPQALHKPLDAERV